jgi:CRP-like cAMP-binding protein
MAVLEQLAERAERVLVQGGTAVIRAGEVGHEYFVIVAGRAHARDAAGDHPAMGPGEGFGEIALLREVPRTATVLADTAVELLAVHRADFLVAVGYSSAAAAAAAVSAERLARSGGEAD